MLILALFSLSLELVGLWNFLPHLCGEAHICPFWEYGVCSSSHRVNSLTCFSLGQRCLYFPCFGPCFSCSLWFLGFWCYAGISWVTLIYFTVWFYVYIYTISVHWSTPVASSDYGHGSAWHSMCSFLSLNLCFYCCPSCSFGVKCWVFSPISSKYIYIILPIPLTRSFFTSGTMWLTSLVPGLSVRALGLVCCTSVYLYLPAVCPLFYLTCFILLFSLYAQLCCNWHALGLVLLCFLLLCWIVCVTAPLQCLVCLVHFVASLPHIWLCALVQTDVVLLISYWNRHY